MEGAGVDFGGVTTFVNLHRASVLFGPKQCNTPQHGRSAHSKKLPENRKRRPHLANQLATQPPSALQVPVKH